MVRAVKNIVRLCRIGWILGRHDLLQPVAHSHPVLGFLNLITTHVQMADLPERPGQRLAKALTDLGPTFVKLGQALSIRADILSEQMCQDLAELQDGVSAFSAIEARNVIETALGQPIEALFSFFETVPTAAASIAQVHFAQTHDGKDVAIKVLRPNVEQQFAKDLALFRWGAEWIERLFPRSRRLKPVDVIQVLEESVQMELDLRLEAAAAEEMSEFFEKSGHELCFRVPKINWELTSQRVLTMERIDGIPLGDRQKLLEAEIDLDALLSHAASAMFLQVFEFGYFHADMHPGNFLVEPDGTLVMLDFGIMGRLDLKSRLYLAEMLMGFLTGDYRRVAEIHFQAGYVPAHKSVDYFTQACRSIGQPILGKPLAEISLGRLLGQLFQITETFEMETQPQLLMLQKTMMLAEGVGRLLKPDANMWQLAEPLIESWVTKHLSLPGKVYRQGQEFTDILKDFPQIARLLETRLKNATSTDYRSELHLLKERINLQSFWLGCLSLALATSLISMFLL